jgi:hypothetical protein
MGRYGLVLLALALAIPASAGEPELERPVLLLASGKPIKATGGWAAPIFADLDGDGRRELIVGQFHGNPPVYPHVHKARARIYANRGSDAKPVFEDFEYFRAANEGGWINSG